MLFNSLSFLLFLPVVFILYWFVIQKSLSRQNILLLIASYVFYAAWDWKFLFLLAFSTLLDFFTGIQIFNAETKAGKKTWLWISIAINLGFLCFFKYFNFFVDSFADMASVAGLNIDKVTLNIILPVGISFYTFHGLSYVFDIYNEKIKPSRNFVNYSLFVSFFPLLVAGPIERATHLLPQVEKRRVFNYDQAVDGLKQILWGLFKKMVIADGCAEFANNIFNNPGAYPGTTLFLGAVFFAFQIYGDFSGYTDIALGVARLFGFELLRNFNYPYFSRDIAEFWRRWHISLSSWFRDYLYIPLGGSKGGNWMKARNTLIIFLVSGFWHGANWTFLAWGLINALYIMPLILFGNNRDNLDIVAKDKIFPTPKEFVAMLSTFLLTVFAWIFFRASSIQAAFSFIEGIFRDVFKPDSYHRTAGFLRWEVGFTLPVIIIFFFVIEWLGRQQKYAIEQFGISWPKSLKWTFYYVLIAYCILYSGKDQQFIYFQF